MTTYDLIVCRNCLRTGLGFWCENECVDDDLEALNDNAYQSDCIMGLTPLWEHKTLPQIRHDED